jgi:hypothetical protein
MLSIKDVRKVADIEKIIYQFLRQSTLQRKDTYHATRGGCLQHFDGRGVAGGYTSKASSA